MAAPTLPPAPRPRAWKTLAPSPPVASSTSTFASQSSLPHLPVPALSTTLSKLRASLIPLAKDAGELSAAEKKIDAFGAGFGPVLQERLEKHAQGKEHWLEEWWDDLGYLGYRDSVVINVSYYYGFSDTPSHLPDTPTHRAASLTRAALLFRQTLQRGELPPEGTKDTPFCMDTFRWMFDCARVPGTEGLDWSVTYAGTSKASGHVVVIRNGRFWRVDATRDGRILSTSELEAQIQYIIAHSGEPHPGVGVLTASNRDVWATDYTHLAADPTNASILETLHSAAFVLALDTSVPSDMIEHSRFLWHGEVTGTRIGLSDRWVDKPVQLIVFDNAKAGLMGEHSVMDGTPVVTLSDWILTKLADPSFDHGTPSTAAESFPTPLNWKVDDTTTRAISAAEAAARELVGSQAMGIHQTAYGKRAIKAFGASPDSWAQLIVQLAYARLTGGGVAATYEAATTRRFIKGRTEAIRVATTESRKWVQAMDDKSKSVDERRSLFREAVKVHGDSARAAGKGEGIDRHLLGLKQVLQGGEPMPELFEDPLVKRSSHWILSTSAVFSKHFRPYGWGEVVPEGYGVAYMTGFDVFRPDYLQYTVTSRTEMPNAAFVHEIEQAARDIHQLFSEGGDRKSRL
ncbi:acyltransferase ChoActase/COT/CPT [Artomyces pyxidatus]|uniref:Acyltransferase ChoActase/COT/CPT n=1 Tax=Artomyces pyxidatus TaxID=48021 RepID=A0ACB8SVT0_9AGAM|nr:acyltransferase ChoActase/COT/CPT [Artomyces pyxidatus]